MNKSMREMSYAIITAIFLIICAGIMLVGIFCVKEEDIHIADAIISFMEVGAIAFLAASLYLYKKFGMLISLIIIVVCEILKVFLELFREDGIYKCFLYYIPRIKTFSFLLILFLLFIYFKQNIVLTKKLRILFYLPAIDSLFFMSMIFLFSKENNAYEFCDVLRIMFCIIEALAMLFLAKWFIFAAELDDDINSNENEANDKNLYLNSTYQREKALKNYELIESIIEDIVRNYNENKEKKDESTNDKIFNFKKPVGLDKEYTSCSDISTRIDDEAIIDTKENDDTTNNTNNDIIIGSNESTDNSIKKEVDIITKSDESNNIEIKKEVDIISNSDENVDNNEIKKEVDIITGSDESIDNIKENSDTNYKDNFYDVDDEDNFTRYADETDILTEQVLDGNIEETSKESISPLEKMKKIIKADKVVQKQVKPKKSQKKKFFLKKDDSLTNDDEKTEVANDALIKAQDDITKEEKVDDENSLDKDTNNTEKKIKLKKSVDLKKKSKKKNTEFVNDVPLNIKKK